MQKKFCILLILLGMNIPLNLYHSTDIKTVSQYLFNALKMKLFVQAKQNSPALETPPVFVSLLLFFSFFAFFP